MAKKKSKRPNLPQETLERARAELRGDKVEAATVAPVAEPANGSAAAAAPVKKVKRPGSGLATRRIPSIDDLIAEYNYVPKELRNLAHNSLYRERRSRTDSSSSQAGCLNSRRVKGHGCRWTFRLTAGQSCSIFWETFTRFPSTVAMHRL